MVSRAPTRGAQGPAVLLDGALGTELERRGIVLPAPAWSAHAVDVRPDAVSAIHRDYAAAGATVHTAATFRTRRRDVGDAWQRLAARAVSLARDAVDPSHRVAGSLGPVEDCYRPDRSPGRAASEEHRAVARVLADAGVDLILCETFANGEEARVAVEQAVATGLETWVSLTAGPAGDLMTPAVMASVARACRDAGARIVLVGCTAARSTLSYLEAVAATGGACGAYANAGGTHEGLGWGADPQRASRAYATIAAEWLACGASVVGGCCGTTPMHIAALAELARPAAAVPT